MSNLAPVQMYQCVYDTMIKRRGSRRWSDWAKQGIEASDDTNGGKLLGIASSNLLLTYYLSANKLTAKSSKQKTSTAIQNDEPEIRYLDF